MENDNVVNGLLRRRQEVADALEIAQGRVRQLVLDLDALDATLRELGDQYNAATLVAAYVDGLEAAASRAPKARPAYARVLQEAASMARARARG